MLKVCIDTNIWISGVIFGGKPAEVVTAAINLNLLVVYFAHFLDKRIPYLNIQAKIVQRLDSPGVA